MENQTITTSEAKPPKKNAWFGKIETKEDAVKVIKDSSNGFFFLAALQIVIGYFLLGLPAIIDGVIFAVLAFLLRQFQSMVVAILLLILSVGGIVVTAINQFGGGTGGRNMILALIMIWVWQVPQKEKCPFHFRKNPPPRKSGKQGTFLLFGVAE